MLQWVGILKAPTGHFCRSKRQESECLNCSRDWSDTDGIWYKLREYANCTGKNIMICKHCTTHNMHGISDQSTHRRGFSQYESWCFDTGCAILFLSFLLPVSLCDKLLCFPYLLCWPGKLYRFQFLTSLSFHAAILSTG